MTIHEVVLTQLAQRDSAATDAAPTTLGDSFLIAASSLLIMAGRIQHLSRDTDPLNLQQNLIRQVHQLELHLQQKNVRTEQILIAKYFICALLDDLIEYEWLDGHGLWRSHALLFHFFQENNADERVFTLIERLQQEPSVNIALIEFAYMVLIYGYQGRYRHMSNGYFKLLEKVDELYQVLNWHYGDFRKSLFIQQRT